MKHHPKILEMSKKFKRDPDEFLLRADGRVEWVCEHGVGHTVWYPKGSNDVHGCCQEACCKIFMGLPEVKVYLKKLREITPCNKCGKKPIEWHNPNHVNNRHRRISSLVQRGSTKSIFEELKLCVPLCRSCHMKEDGRIVELLKKAPHQKGYSEEPKSCICCGKKYKPLRRQMCYTCYENNRVGGRSYKGPKA